MNKNNDFKKFRFLGEGFPKGVLFRGDGILHPAFYLKRLTKKKKNVGFCLIVTLKFFTHESVSFFFPNISNKNLILLLQDCL